MRAYGRHKQHPGNLPGFKIPKGHVAWWEYECDKVKSKKSKRQQTKLEINEELLNEEQ
jgi:hypothetical protein